MSSLIAAKQIKPPEWMRGPGVTRVMEVLNEGRALAARFVGGCVRNELLGRPVKDIDIATIWTPNVVTERLEKAGIKVVPTGLEHGTVTAVTQETPFEITTLRRDVETDGRRAVVAFTEDWREDAARRDFTMNTLLADPKGRIYDPTGRGLADLERGRVVFVGDPDARIAEDHLRILRFFRFHAWYGTGEPDGPALAACRAAADKIGTLSTERVSQEWFKILSVDWPVDILELIIKNNILSDFFESKYEKDVLERLAELEMRHDLISLAARLYVLGGMQTGFYREKLILSNSLYRDIESISEAVQLPVLSQDHMVRVAVYKYGRDAAAQTLFIETAQGLVNEYYVEPALVIIRGWEIPVFPVSGEDLKRQGFKEGPELGRALQKLEARWIEYDFQMSKDVLLKKIQ